MIFYIKLLMKTDKINLAKKSARAYKYSMKNVAFQAMHTSERLFFGHTG